jgi:hypothetical protein
MKSRRLKVSVLIISLLVLTAGIGHSGNSTLSLPPAAATESIKPEDLLAHEEFLASDELGGRYTFSDSNRIAARYLASRLRSFGYRGGAGEGSFFQPLDLQTKKLSADQTFLELPTEAGAKRFQHGGGFTLFAADASSQVEADLVYVRFGVTLPERGYDDYANVDVKGKIAVVLLSGLPDVGKEGSRLTNQEYNFNRKLSNALSHGAKAVIFIRNSSRGNPPRGNISTREQIVARNENAPQNAGISLTAGDGLATEIFSGTGISTENFSSAQTAPEPKALGKTVKLQVTVEQQTQPAQNVIGILDGSDARLRNEYIVFSAHYDHLQTRDGQIYNGADDDGSGTSAVLEIAQAFTIGERPKRSILVIFHTGEEIGLLGAKHFVEHPTVPLTSIVTDLNIDMIGRSRSPQDTHPANQELSDSNTVYLIGSDKLSRELHELSEQTNKETEQMTFDYRYNSENHPQRLYYRSDHYMYAEKGIPVIFYFTGLHQDYHRPTDDVEKIDFQKMTRITRLIFATGWRIANLDHRLKLNGSANNQRAN